MNELIFPVEIAPEDGYTARALGESIFTEADSLEELPDKVRYAVRCHYEEAKRRRLSDSIKCAKTSSPYETSA